MEQHWSGEKVVVEPERNELQHEDETHVASKPYLRRVWHRRGQQPTLPVMGTNRWLTVVGILEVLEERHCANGRDAYLVLDNGS